MVFVVPTMMQPARLSFLTKGPSVRPRNARSSSVPAPAGVPSTAKISLTAIGTPIKGPRSVPACNSPSMFRAVAKARSASTVRKAPILPSSRPMRAKIVGGRAFGADLAASQLLRKIAKTIASQWIGRGLHQIGRKLASAATGKGVATRRAPASALKGSRDRPRASAPRQCSAAKTKLRRRQPVNPTGPKPHFLYYMSSIFIEYRGDERRCRCVASDTEISNKIWILCRVRRMALSHGDAPAVTDASLLCCELVIRLDT